MVRYLPIHVLSLEPLSFLSSGLVLRGDSFISGRSYLDLKPIWFLNDTFSVPVVDVRKLISSWKATERLKPIRESFFLFLHFLINFNYV